MADLYHVTRLQLAEAQRDTYRLALELIADEVGGNPDEPWTVLQAAQSLRDALARSKGYADTPLDADGQRVPHRVIGR